jgi:peptide/nickel transport system substrate-binding protein
MLFLRLAELGPTLATAGEESFVPVLAESWERRDSVTLVFHLDARARWHDGVPVTAADVLFSFERARDPAISAQLATVLSTIQEVTAEGDLTVVFRFDRPFPEQFYTAVYHVQPLPAHLLAQLDPDSIAGSPYMQAPVGNGPYRFGRLVPGQQLTLTANDDFFLGRPGIERVIFLLASDADARLNLLLSGEADILQSAAAADVPRIEAEPSLRVMAIAGNLVGYLLFNQRNPDDLDQPHPVLADRRVRTAIIHALDRDAMVRAIFDEYADVPHGPVAQLHWIRDTTDRGIPYDPREAKALLRQAGWQETADGWQRNGEPLTLSLNYPTTSRARSQFAQLIQEQLRQVGISLELVGLDGAIWFERRGRRNFDIDFSSAVMDPSPSGMQQSWTCAGIGGSNVGYYCNPEVDSLIARAIYQTGDGLATWRAALETIEYDAPAAFIYSPLVIFGIDSRFGNVALVPYSYWLDLWRWTVHDGPAPDAAP